MTDEQLAFKRVQRVRAAEWLSVTDLAFHLGVSEGKAREWMRLPDFPTGSNPTGSWKEKRWSKTKVDAWMEAHSEPVGN